MVLFRKRCHAPVSSSIRKFRVGSFVVEYGVMRSGSHLFAATSEQKSEFIVLWGDHGPAIVPRWNWPALLTTR